jgi:intracellular sulfur oxidation DsrE/DsrF family protein
MKRKYTAFLTGLMLLLACHLAQSGDLAINDQAALAGLEVGRGVFLVDIGDAKKLNLYLELIQGTYQGLKDQGVKPDFVLVFIGPSVKFLSASPAAGVEEEAGGVLMEIESSVEALDSLGVRQEVCAVATRVFGIDNNTILPGMNIVSDGFISLIGYQAQGYHLVPVF